MKKLQQYYIFKFKSSRLKRIKYNINIDLKTAFSNGEVVTLGESEVIRAINRIKNIQISPEIVQNLLKTRRNLKKLENSEENRKKIVEINQKLYDLLFIPEIVNVEFEDTRHYASIIKNGLFVNGNKYIRLLAGAGMTRRSTVQFVEEKFSLVLKTILENDYNKDIEIVDSKFNAYYALVSSATYPVSTPRFCVIKDCKITKERLVDFVVETAEGDDDEVEERLMPIENNLFDGQGLVSFQMAAQWAKDTELNYIPTSFCIRGAYLKGQCVVFDFIKFAEEIAHNFFITDIWGDQIDVRDVDVILTESQLKLWYAYRNAEEYRQACEKNHLGWGISRFSPKKEKDYFYSSYQLLQVLDLEEEEIKQMCQPTIDWLKNISTRNVDHALLYLIGNISENEELEPSWFDEVENPILKALLLNKHLFDDSYIRKSIYQTLNKKIREVRMGKLLFPGNWQVCISDPYAFCEHLFGMEKINGLLSEGEHYCHYWNEKNIDLVASGRSPLTWISEMNILHLKQNDALKKWFGHIKSGIIFNVHGVDTMLMADSDFDYDIAFSTSQKEFIYGATGGKPITYEKKLPIKNKVDESKLYVADINTMGSKIGWITNLGTTLYALLPLFERDSKEYKEIIKRLMIIRKAQGNEIDRGKGILTKKLPNWDKWLNSNDAKTQEEKDKIELHNKLVINRRPKFMIYLYEDYMRKYKNHFDIYQNYCESLYGCGIEELKQKKNRSSYEEEIIYKYSEFNPFIDSHSVMGIICDYMEKSLNEIKISLKKENNSDIIISSLLSESSYTPTEKNFRQIIALYHKYKTIKQGIYQFDDTNESIGHKLAEINREAYETISVSGAELANLAVYLCYKYYRNVSSRDFCWKVFGNEIIDNMIANGYDRAMIPLVDEFGDIYYLGKRYSYYGVKVD